MTKDDVLAAGLEILDTFGLADLSMRRIGSSLGVRASALYYHVPDKQSLLAGVADLLLADVASPARGAGEDRWREGVAAWAHSLREVLLAHRDSAELVASARAFRLLSADITAEPAALLARAGASAAQAASGAMTLLYFVLGHVAEEQARLSWEQFGKPAPGETRLIDEHTFRAGVDTVLAGVAARLALA